MSRQATGDGYHTTLHLGFDRAMVKVVLSVLFVFSSGESDVVQGIYGLGNDALRDATTKENSNFNWSFLVFREKFLTPVSRF
eukprot:IDg3740t1